MSAYETGLQFGDLISLVFIVLILVLLIASARRTKTLRSFQAEMLVFAVVLFAAEIPEIMSTLGLVNLSYILDLGGELHAASMTILVAFVTYRILGFTRAK